MSGTVFSSFTSTLQTTVTGPGTLTFWWLNPSFYNTLTFSASGTNLEFINYYPPLGGKNPGTRQDPHEHWVFFQATREVTREPREVAPHLG
jgi:hypothetical protein